MQPTYCVKRYANDTAHRYPATLKSLLLISYNIIIIYIRVGTISRIFQELVE